MTIEDNIRSLAALRFFSRMEPEALRMVAFATESRNLRAGDVLFRQGDVADCGYLILSGAIAIETGHQGEASLKILNPGDLIGELALLIATKRPVTAIARQSSVVLRIARALFLRVLEDYPASADRLRKELLGQINSLGGDMESLRRDLLEENRTTS